MTEHSDAIESGPSAAESTSPRDRKSLARQVARYLMQNPDFFADHLELLENMRLPRQNGKTVSLMTHQTNLLRERNIEMRQRLDQLLNAARENDALFLHTRRLVLALLEAAELSEAANALQRSFEKDFGVEFTALTLFEPVPSSQRCDALNVRSRTSGEAAIGALLRNGRTVCGVLRGSEKQFLFGDQADHVASAAVVPLANQLGVLAVGSGDAQHYSSSLDTMFLSYIGEVLERVLPDLMNRG